MIKSYIIKPLCLIAAVLMLISQPICTSAEDRDSESYAIALSMLSIFRGTEKGFRLEKTLNRAEAVTLIIRLCGEERKALASASPQPFYDVPEWADRYIAYAYAEGITEGKGGGRFDPHSAVKEWEFLTMLLRMLGYSEGKGKDFLWDQPYEAAIEAGLIPKAERDMNFLRRGAVKLCFRALLSAPKGGGRRLCDTLISLGIFDEDSFDAALTIAGLKKQEAPREEETEPPKTETDPPKAETDPPQSTDTGRGDGWSGIIVP